MKNIILVALIVTTLACKAQSPIIDLNDRQTELVDGAYLKDVNNELDKFVGTWIYTNGNTSLTITFQKKIQVQSRIYSDILVGEYKYIENGVEKINTLSNFDNQDNLESLYEHNLISSFIIYKKEFPGCTNCNDNEKRVKIDVSDPDPLVDYLEDTMYMGLRYISEFSVPDKMQIDFARRGAVIIPEGAPQEPNLPFGRYILTKQ